MSIMIAIYSGDSKRPVAKCDAHCYNSTTEPSWCNCLCGEINHGVGVNQAVENTITHGQEWADKWLANHHIDNPRVVFFTRPVQYALDLYPEESS